MISPKFVLLDFLNCTKFDFWPNLESEKLKFGQIQSVKIRILAKVREWKIEIWPNLECENLNFGQIWAVKIWSLVKNRPSKLSTFSSWRGLFLLEALYIMCTVNQTWIMGYYTIFQNYAHTSILWKSPRPPNLSIASAIWLVFSWTWLATFAQSKNSLRRNIAMIHIITVWKFKNFSATWILCENSESPKMQKWPFFNTKNL